MKTSERKMGARRRARVRALQLLYALETRGRSLSGRSIPSEDLAKGISEITLHFPSIIDGGVVKENAASEDEVYAIRLVQGVIGRLSEIDDALVAASDHWRPSRMDVVDRCLLRIGVYELISVHEVPPAVTINEAVDLAVDYASERSASFVNGLLDGVRKRLQKQTPRK